MVTTLPHSEGVSTGPTWQRDASGKFVLPKYTLGWQVLGWTADYLLQPDGPDAGEPWRFTDEQARFVLHWYAVNEQGRFVYRYGMWRRLKGHGKDPLAAALCCAEFLGPCRFGGWKGGEPLAVPHYAACVQIAAVSAGQAKRNTMSLFPAMLSARALEEYGVDMGKEIIYAHRGRCRIEMLTASARSAEGPRPTLIIKNESHHWIHSNGGPEMSAVVARNAAKSRDGSTRVLAISNAHAPGEDSDAERDWEAYRLGAKDMLYDSREAPDVPDLNDTEALRAALLYARGDSTWLDIDRLIAEVQDPRTPENEARRFYLNQLAASADRAFDAEQWACLVAHKTVEEGAQIALGFDGSINRDHTVLIGTELATGYQFVVGYWEPQDVGGDWRIPEAEVDEAVAAAFDRFTVERFYADPPYWREHLAKWEGAYNRPGKAVVAGWPTNSYRRMAASLVEYRKAIDGGDLTHDGDQRFVDGIRNAHKKYQAFVNEDGEKMWTIQKERPDSPLKIDAAMAGCLSWQARNDAIADGALGSYGVSEAQAFVFGEGE